MMVFIGKIAIICGLEFWISKFFCLNFSFKFQFRDGKKFFVNMGENVLKHSLKSP